MLTALPDSWFNITGKTQRPTVANTSGSIAVTYADHLTNLAARLVVNRGGESGSVRLNSQAPFRLYLSGAPDVTAKDRFVYSNRVFDISNVNNFDEAGVYTACDCVEVQPSGAGS